MSIIKKLASGTADSISDDIEYLRTQSTSSVIQRAVVYDTLNNLSIRDDDAIKVLKEQILNPEDFDIAPRNAVVVKFISKGKGRSNKSLVVCFPFFSSHISLPIKSGEQIWVILETPDDSEIRGYWLSRIHEPVFVEDSNYTHGDRRYSVTQTSLNITLDKDGAEEKLSNIPTFQNGKSVVMDDPDKLTLGDVDGYEQIASGSAESSAFIIEPIPRYTKRPGDLVLQGSHNATIVLGTDRGYTAKDSIDPTKSNALPTEKVEPGKGSIDVVVGRGRIHALLEELDGKEKRDKTPSRTEPRVIKTKLGKTEVFETDKNISVVDDKKFSNTRSHAAEGDPDFVNDATRLYLTMKSDPDKEFNIVEKNIPSAFSAKPSEIKDTAAAVIKSDEVRIIARRTGLESQKTAEPGGENKITKEINGSIRIIKEGKLDTDAASIYLLPDGTVQISGKEIYFGRTAADGGLAKSTGASESEPYLRMSDFEKWADALIDAVNTAFTNAETAINSNGDASNASGMSGMFGGTVNYLTMIPIPAPNLPLGKAFSELISPGGMTGNYAFSPDKTAIEKFKSTKEAMEAIKSKRIFGE